MNRVNFDSMTIFLNARLIALLVGAVVLTGCNRGDRPPLGTVHGKITMDGKPLSGANIGFVPTGGGHESYGITDAEGNYALTSISATSWGAKVGTHTVRINTVHYPADMMETVPARYNVKSTLQKEVNLGRQRHRF